MYAGRVIARCESPFKSSAHLYSVSEAATYRGRLRVTMTLYLPGYPEASRCIRGRAFHKNRNHRKLCVLSPKGNN